MGNKTAMQILIERLDNEISFIKDDDASADKHYRNGLKIAKEHATALLETEREQILNAFVAGDERGTKEIPFNAEQYFTQTFKK